MEWIPLQFCNFLFVSKWCENAHFAQLTTHFNNSMVEKSDQTHKGTPFFQSFCKNYVDFPFGMCYNSVTKQILRGNSMTTEQTPLSYKGRPLRRKDNLIYYGSMADQYIIMLQILSTKTVDGLDMADRVSVQLQLTDPDLKSRDRVVKKSEKDSLYAAMDIASVWLERALNSK
jgi:hypothetical protein